MSQGSTLYIKSAFFDTLDSSGHNSSFIKHDCPAGKARAIVDPHIFIYTTTRLSNLCPASALEVPYPDRSVRAKTYASPIRKSEGGDGSAWAVQCTNKRQPGRMGLRTSEGCRGHMQTVQLEVGRGVARGGHVRKCC